MGADLILTWCTFPHYDDGEPVQFLDYDGENRRWFLTEQGKATLPILLGRVDSLSVERCIDFTIQRGVDLTDLLPEHLDDETFPTINLHDGQSITRLTIGGPAASTAEDGEQLTDAQRTSIADAVRIRVRGALTALFAAEYPPRDCNLLRPEVKPLLFTGGMSWGDEPSDSYDYVLDIGVAGITDLPVGPNPDAEQLDDKPRDYTVSLTNTFEATSPEEAVTQMADYAVDNGHSAGYRVTWTLANGREHPGMFVDAEDIPPNLNLEI